MVEHNEKSKTTWIEHAKARGINGSLATLLDVLAPLGPLASQMLYVVQPMATAFGGRQAVGDIAAALDSEAGIADLRQQLLADDDEQ